MELKEIGPILAGSAFGGIFTFNRIGGVAVPWLMGLAMEGISAGAGFFFIAGGALIPPVLVLFLREPGRRVTAAVQAASD